MVLCKTLNVGDINCYEYKGKYLGKLLKIEQVIIGYNQGSPRFGSGYFFEKHSEVPVLNVSKVVAFKSNAVVPEEYYLSEYHDVTIVPCQKNGGRRKTKRVFRKKRNSKKIRR